MRDDQRSDNPSDRDDRRDAFDDALDDLFGLDEPDDIPPSEPEPSPPSPPVTEFNQPSFTSQEPQTPLNPITSSPAEGGKRRNWTRIGCFTCLGFAGLIFTCFFILFIIGLVAGDPADATPTSRIWHDLAAMESVVA